MSVETYDTYTVEEAGHDRDGPFYIPATSMPAYRPRTLKDGDTFVVMDPFGDIQARNEGLFHTDTRFVSRLVLLVNDRRPLLLSSRVSEDNASVGVDLTNPDIIAGDQIVLPRDLVHIQRTKTLDEATYFERLLIRNYAAHSIDFELSIVIEADFADIFEIRGQQRPRRGRLRPVQVAPEGLNFGYRGLDGIERSTLVICTPAPVRRRAGRLSWPLRLAPKESTIIDLSVRCVVARDRSERRTNYVAAIEANRDWLVRRRRSAAHIYSSNEGFNDWLNRSRADLDMLLTRTEFGPFPYAGIPWFSTAFGRDAIITALQTLWVDPEVARGTLGFLASTQTADSIPERDAEPGKILHELRHGEMARLGEVPVDRYYGTVDATPLFVVLAGAYLDRTGDLDLVRHIFPNIRAAMEWIEHHGDADGDGFIEYDRKAENGLGNQGWKDSGTAIFHADGSLAEPPIALCEVQGYAYLAYLAAAKIARTLGHDEMAPHWETRAEVLRVRFEEAFWCPELGLYALALDGRKNPCRVRASNAGHALWSGIAVPDRASVVVQALLSPAFFSGWGIRTVADGESLYNPMSYHCGSVWPHDNSLIAAGFARYGFRDEAARILTAFFEASQFMDLRRLPELFCGFERRPGEGPTDYPVACAPQAWSSGTAFALLGACLGISFDAWAGQIRLQHPVLPTWLNEIKVTNLRLAQSRVDLLFRRHQRDVAVNAIEKEGEVSVTVIA